MSRYEKWLKRKENATPYAYEANCRKCKFSEIICSHIYCSGQGKAKRLPFASWDTDKMCFCPEYIPKEIKNEVSGDLAQNGQITHLGRLTF